MAPARARQGPLRGSIDAVAAWRMQPFGAAGHVKRRIVAVSRQWVLFLTSMPSPATAGPLDRAGDCGCLPALIGWWIGVLITPRATALTRTPRDAYSIASERVTAASPPFVSEASADGRFTVGVVDQAGGDVHHMR
jgi:hypothetical protein